QQFVPRLVQVRRAAVLHPDQRDEYGRTAGGVRHETIAADVIRDRVSSHDLPAVTADERAQLRIAAIETLEQRACFLVVESAGRREQDDELALTSFAVRRELGDALAVV